MEVAHRNIVENLICMQICPLAILYCEVLMQSHRAALMDYQDFQPGTECTTWMYHPALPHKHSHLPSAPTGSCLHTCIFKMTTCCWLYVPALSPDHSSYKITFSNCSYAKTKIHILNINIFTSLNSLPFISLSQKQTKNIHPHIPWLNFAVKFILSPGTCLLSEVFALPPLPPPPFPQTWKERQL